MNSLVIPNEGKPDLLRYQLISPISGVNAWSLRLFVNDIEPDADTVLSDMEEASFVGYAYITMTRSEWTEPTVDTSDGFAKSTWKTDPSTWTNGGSEVTIYGTYYTDDDMGVIRGVFLFDTPWVLAAGATIPVLPAFWYGSYSPCPPVP